MQLLKTGREPYTASLIYQTLKQKKEDLTLKLTPSLDSKLQCMQRPINGRTRNASEPLGAYHLSPR